MPIVVYIHGVRSGVSFEHKLLTVRMDRVGSVKGMFLRGNWRRGVCIDKSSIIRTLVKGRTRSKYDTHRRDAVWTSAGYDQERFRFADEDGS